ncbi:hypothetical protein UPYG_G00315290 [Umbra pygmaea]|uniref:Uncharacterized protein n=1 Tax=Umbra pygmaea TaxID=75934 RepID=A0ABD0VZP4_UMBPY
MDMGPEEDDSDIYSTQEDNVEEDVQEESGKESDVRDSRLDAELTSSTALYNSSRRGLMTQPKIINAETPTMPGYHIQRACYDSSSSVSNTNHSYVFPCFRE